MASTVSASTLKVTITESITLNGSNQGATNTVSISNVDEVFKRIITCPANNETRIADFHSSVSDATITPFDVQDVVYMRLTNLDDTNNITISLHIDVGEDDTTADETASILIQPGKSFIMGTPHDGIAVSDANANFITDLQDLEAIVVQPGANAIDVELFVASASA